MYIHIIHASSKSPKNSLDSAVCNIDVKTHMRPILYCMALQDHGFQANLKETCMRCEGYAVPNTCI